MQYSSKNQSAVVNSEKNTPRFSMLSMAAVTSVVMLTLLFSAHASADSAKMNDGNVVAVSQQDNEDAKVSVSHQEMNAESKKKMPASDNRIGAFSRKDGSMEGAYGDGDWGN